MAVQPGARHIKYRVRKRYTAKNKLDGKCADNKYWSRLKERERERERPARGWQKDRIKTRQGGIDHQKTEHIRLGEIGVRHVYNAYADY